MTILRNKGMFIFKTSLSITFLYWLFKWGINEASIEKLFDINAVDLTIAIFLLFTAFTLLLFRWHTLIEKNHNVTRMELIPSFYIGVFSGNFLPGNLSGDFIRASFLFKLGIPITTLIITSIIDRFIGLFVSMTICIIAISISAVDYFKYDFYINLILIFLSISLLIPVIMSNASSKTLKTLNHYKVKKQWIEHFKLLHTIMKNIGKNPFSVTKSIALSLLSTLCVITAYYVLAKGIGINVTFNTLCIIVPLSFFASSLPISIGGIGIREGIVVYLLSLFGTPYEQGISLNVLYLFVLIIVTLPCGLFLFKTNFKTIPRTSS